MEQMKLVFPKPFKWEDLDGKTLEIKMGMDEAPEDDITTVCIIGYERKTGKCYLLHEDRRINDGTRSNN